MILDNQALYANAQAVRATGDVPSTNSFDHGPGNAGPGLSGSMLLVTVTGTFLSGGATTLQAVLQQSSDNAAWTDVIELTPAVPIVSLTGRKVLVQARFPGLLRRYTRIVWRVTGAAPTDGFVSAAITPDLNAQQYMPSGFRVNA